MIIGFIKQAEAGLPIKELTHLHSAEPQQCVQRLGKAMVHVTRDDALRKTAERSPQLGKPSKGAALGPQPTKGACATRHPAGCRRGEERKASIRAERATLAGAFCDVGADFGVAAWRL